MDMLEKLEVLSGAAKYDVACASSGVARGSVVGGIGTAASCGICHSFSADGRCISLLKVLLSNACIYDCEYCINRRSNDRVKRATFTPEELADLTIQFYRRNYIEGLFLSSGVVRDPDYTCQLLIKTLYLLRHEHRFGGYIHAKAIPGAAPALLQQLGLLADRMSVNIELPSHKSLALLAPDKSKQSILQPMEYVHRAIAQNSTEMVRYRNAPKFVPGGQSTQMIVGATPESDYQILRLAEGLYRKYRLKRVYYSAYLPVGESKNLPAVTQKPPLLREHRLYQADFLLRMYQFEADELLSPQNPNFNPLLDPKCNWAIHNLDRFPVEVNRADYETLLRVPGIGVRSARRIVVARRARSLDFDALKKIGVVLKRAKYFLLCRGRAFSGIEMTHEAVLRALLSDAALRELGQSAEQLSLFAHSREEVAQCLTAAM